MTRDLAVVGASAGELATAIRSGGVSSREVVDAHIAHIEAQQDRLNAMVLPMYEAARDAADAADRAQAAGAELGPLHGVPITIKAQFLVAGSETTMGVPHFQGRIDPEDGPLVARLRRAGAIILGKSNVMQMLVGYESDNPLYGRTNNPWGLDRTPGGSSGGEAALIASGVPLGLGGDLGGSIRLPAHFCGIHGLKPTSCRLPNDDTPGPDFFAMGQNTIVPQPGPMARTVADLKLAMSILVGPYDEPLFDPVPPVPWPDADTVDVSRLTIGVYDDNNLFTPSPALRRAVREAADHLSDLGAKVVDFPAPDAEHCVSLFINILSGDASRAMMRALKPDRPNHVLKPVLQGGAMPRPMKALVSKLLAASGQRTASILVAAGGDLPTSRHWELVSACDTYRIELLARMRAAGVDVLLCPPFGLAAARHGTTTDLFGAAAYATQFNLTGFPAGVVAATRVRPGEESDRSPGRDKAEKVAADCEAGSAGLPVGVQVAAAPWREDRVLAVMAALEAKFREGRDYPGLAPTA